MIISQKHNFAFIHNPKVGGTSIRKALDKYHDAGRPFWHQGWDVRNQRVQDWAHVPVRDLDPLLTQWMYQENIFVFGFVREPMSRFWSSLAEFRRQHADWYPAKLCADDFVCYFLTEANVRYDWRFVHFCPQHYFLGDYTSPSFVGHHERFAEDWESIKQKLGLEIPELKNERHRVKGEPERLSAEALEILHRLYNHDCIIFDYPPILDAPSAITHEYRISQIHDPRCMRAADLEASLTDGERIAYNSIFRHTK